MQPHHPLNSEKQPLQSVTSLTVGRVLSGTMPLHLNQLSKAPPDQAGESDLYLIPTIAKIHVDAWQTSELNRHLFYGGPSTHPGIVDMQIARHKNSLLNDPTCQIVTVLHCGEPEVGEQWKVISFIKYNIFETEESLHTRIDAGKREWPPYTNLGMIDHFWGECVKYRKRYAETLGPHVSVDILATEPDWHGHGAGRLLMQKACSDADDRGLPMYLEGSEVGMKLYESCGFERKDTMWVDLGRWPEGKDLGPRWRGENVKVKEGEGDGWYQQVVMVRPAKKR